MTLGREPEHRQARPDEGWGAETLVVERSATGRGYPHARTAGLESDPAYQEWDRSEWVGEGQEPADVVAGPSPAATEPRWTKWEWIGDRQGEPGPNRGLPAEAMPDGENALGGHRHNPGMAHWGGTRFEPEVAPDEEVEGPIFGSPAPPADADR